MKIDIQRSSRFDNCTDDTLVIRTLNISSLYRHHTSPSISPCNLNTFRYIWHLQTISSIVSHLKVGIRSVKTQQNLDHSVTKSVEFSQKCYSNATLGKL